jgi:hypothetical protein
MKLTLIKTIYQLAISFPAFYKLIKEIWNYFISQEIAAIKRKEISVNQEWAALTKAIVNAENNHERAALSISLNRLSKS